MIFDNSNKKNKDAYKTLCVNFLNNMDNMGNILMEKAMEFSDLISKEEDTSLYFNWSIINKKKRIKGDFFFEDQRELLKSGFSAINKKEEEGKPIFLVSLTQVLSMINEISADESRDMSKLLMNPKMQKVQQDFSQSIGKAFVEIKNIYEKFSTKPTSEETFIILNLTIKCNKTNKNKKRISLLMPFSKVFLVKFMAKAEKLAMSVMSLMNQSMIKPEVNHSAVPVKKNEFNLNFNKR